MKTINKITKVQECGREKTVANDILREERLEQVESFTYLGRTISWNGRIIPKIKC
jgi:hypothetical protein